MNFQMPRGLTAISAMSLSVLAFSACDEDTPLVVVPSETLTLSFQGLEPLANGFHYEGWAIVDGSALSTGKFNVAGGGGLEALDGSAIAGGMFQTGIDLADATAIVITIEPTDDTDAVPADTHIIGGTVASLSAPLTIGSTEAFGDDFAAAAGKYILATPTDSNGGNENSGIWFLTNESGTAEAGLTLPVLPAGWTYEGWAVIDGIPVTTGRFTAVDAADNGAPFSGFLTGPPFPGEDFLVNAPAGLSFPTDLAGQTAVISVEPEPDDGPAPFTLKPLTHAIDAAATDGVTFDMDNGAGTFPTGTATIS